MERLIIHIIIKSKLLRGTTSFSDCTNQCYPIRQHKPKNNHPFIPLTN